MVSFPPQPVITEDNLVVGIDTVIYFTVTDARAATYEVANPLQAIEQLTVTTLRNVIGGMTLEETLTSRDNVNNQLRAVLDEATGRWGIRVNRVELKSVEPPRTVQEAMEKQMRAERDRRATILTAEGVKQSQILTAEGEKQSAVLRAEGQRTAAILKAEGEAKAIETVFGAIHDGAPDQALLSYQYLQMLPELAKGEANKIFVIPSEFSQALSNLTGRFADGVPERRSRRSARNAPTRSTPAPPPTPRRPRAPPARPTTRPRARPPRACRASSPAAARTRLRQAGSVQARTGRVARKATARCAVAFAAHERDGPQPAAARRARRRGARGRRDQDGYGYDVVRRLRAAGLTERRRRVGLRHAAAAAQGRRADVVRRRLSDGPAPALLRHHRARAAAARRAARDLDGVQGGAERAARAQPRSSSSP